MFKKPLCSIVYQLIRCKKISIDNEVGIYEIECTPEVEEKIKADNRFEVCENEFPNLIQTGWNFAKAITKHAVDGFKSVSTQEYENRLRICDTCPFRNAVRCTKCNCNITYKAQWRSERCPADKWNTPIEITLPNKEKNDDK